MPADGDDTTLAVPPLNALPDIPECHGVETSVSSKFEFSKFKASNSRIVAYGLLCIRTVWLIPPCMSTHQIILMPVHDSSLLDFPKTLI
jgi:hypothetical protein